MTCLISCFPAHLCFSKHEKLASREDFASLHKAPILQESWASSFLLEGLCIFQQWALWSAINNLVGLRGSVMRETWVNKGKGGLHLVAPCKSLRFQEVCVSLHPFQTGRINYLAAAWTGSRGSDAAFLEMMPLAGAGESLVSRAGLLWGDGDGLHPNWLREGMAMAQNPCLCSAPHILVNF